MDNAKLWRIARIASVGWSVLIVTNEMADVRVILDQIVPLVDEGSIVHRALGREGIDLSDGGRIRLVPLSRQDGRGWDVDLLVVAPANYSKAQLSTIGEMAVSSSPNFCMVG